VSVLKTKFAARAAKTLRANSTDAERKLWSRLRDRRLLGFRFVRQQPIGPFIADFACREADLVIELDGSQHAEDDAVQYDARRTAILAEHGYQVLRFWNTDALLHTDCVLELIADHLQKGAPNQKKKTKKNKKKPNKKH
jgi:very-short-patch-repair endonuclease